MVQNTRNYWSSGLCPLSGILKTRKERFGNWVCFDPQVEGQMTPALLGPLEKATLNHWTTGPIVGVLLHSPEDRNISSFQNIIS
jgi:hypothetical protein